MGPKVSISFLAISLCAFCTETFVLQNAHPSKLTNAKRGANKLAQALKVIDNQRRKRTQEPVFEEIETPARNSLADLLNDRRGNPFRLNGYYSQPYLRTDTLDYGWNKPQRTGDDYYNYFSDYLDGNADYGDVYPYGSEDISPEPEVSDPSSEELSDIMNDEGEESKAEGIPESPESMSDGPESMSEEPESVSASSEELEDIFRDESDEEREKKTPNWAPHVLGMSGLKRSNGGIHALEEKDGNIRELSDEEVEELLSSAKDAEVKSVDKHVEIESVNGEDRVSAKEIEDILTDEDGDGKKEEIIVEHDIPAEEAEAEINDHMAEVSDNIERTEAEMKQSVEEAEAEMKTNLENMAALTREVLSQFPDEEEDYTVKRKRSDIGADIEEEVDSSDLAKQCLLRYILLEDAENTDLSEALDWATRAQYEGSDSYIPVQVDYLRKAVLREQLLQQLQQECLDLLGLNLGQLENDGEGEEIPERNAVLDVGRPRKRTGEFIPEALEDYEDDEELDDAAIEELLEAGAEAEEEEREREEQEEEEEEEGERVLLAALEDAYQEYVANQLKKYLARQREQNRLAYLPRDLADVIPEDTWYNGPVDDERGDEPRTRLLNPFLREIMEKYQRSGLERSLQDMDYENSVDLPEYPPSLEDMFEDKFLDDGVCAAVEDTTDDCVYALALGWSLDEEAMELCNRHQLCYACGEAHDITADDCDTAYEAEALRACADEADDVACVDEADSLFDLMSRVHQPVYNTRLECQAPCVLDYITGGYFKK